MNLFHPNYAKPGPGVSPDEPRKKGIARIWELLGRDFTPFFLAGTLALAGGVPFLLGVQSAIRAHSWLFAAVAGAVGGMIAAPELCGLADTILRSLRDEPGFWWERYRRSFKRNWKACLVPGAAFGLLVALDVFFFVHLENSVVLGVLLAGLLVLCVAALYVLPQLALLELSTLDILRNALLLSVAWLPRTLAAATVLLGHCVLVYLYFPFTAVEMLLVGSWFPILWALFLIYPALDGAFHVEENIRKMNESKYGGEGKEREG